MQLKRCPNGHYYDPDKYSSCPYCGVQNLDIDIQKTMPKQHVGMPQDVGKTQPRRDVQNNAPADEGKTVAIVKEQLGIDPVVGWLVCIEGSDKGKDYRIRSEKNFIGRSNKMDICIGGDDSVSRENHAIISYNPRNSVFRILPGDSHGLVYLNEEEVLMPEKLNSYDMVEVGKTKLLFVPFCGDKFKWEKEEK